MEIDILASHAEFMPVLASLFEEEWPQYYGAGSRADSLQDLEACCNAGELPVCLVAFEGDKVLGTVSLKESSVLSHKSPFPWVGALLVTPEMRGKGIGTLLVRSAIGKGKDLGYSILYAASERAENIFGKEGWKFHDLLLINGKQTVIYRHHVPGAF